MKILEKLNPHVAAIKPYEPGKPIEDVARELGLDPATISKLASNENALGASPKALAALRESLEETYLYPDGGAYLLREKIAARHGVAMNQVVVGNGSNEVLELIGHCFLGPESHCVFSRHAFVVYKLVSVLMGCRMSETPAAPGYGHDLDAMLDAITDNTNVVFVCNPNNPTGTLLDPAAIERFMERVPEHVIVVFDEAYREIALGPMPDTMQYVHANRNVFITKTFSKAYGLAGLRLGYAIGPAPLCRALEQARQPFNTNRLAQIAGVAALDDDDFVAETLELCRAGKAYIEGECERLGLPYVPGYANFMMIEVGNGGAVAKALEAEGVIVRPIGGYDLPQYIRVTFGTAEENEKFIRALAKVLAK